MYLTLIDNFLVIKKLIFPLILFVKIVQYFSLSLKENNLNGNQTLTSFLGVLPLRIQIDL